MPQQHGVQAEVPQGPRLGQCLPCRSRIELLPCSGVRPPYHGHSSYLATREQNSQGFEKHNIRTTPRYQSESSRSRIFEFIRIMML